MNAVLSLITSVALPDISDVLTLAAKAALASGKSGRTKNGGNAAELPGALKVAAELAGKYIDAQSAAKPPAQPVPKKLLRSAANTALNALPVAKRPETAVIKTLYSLIKAVGLPGRLTSPGKTAYSEKSALPAPASGGKEKKSGSVTGGHND